MTLPRIINALVCDLVRAEIDGKYTCVGIYPQGAVLVRGPYSQVGISFYVEAVGQITGTVNGRFQLRKVGTEIPQYAEDFSFQSTVDARMPIYTNPINFHAQGSGEYVLEWSIDGNWDRVVSFTVMQPAQA